MIKSKLAPHPELAAISEFVHFACTSGAFKKKKKTFLHLLPVRTYSPLDVSGSVNAVHPTFIMDRVNTLGTVLYGAPRFPIEATLANKLVPLTENVIVELAIGNKAMVPFHTLHIISAVPPNDSAVAPHALVQYAVTKYAPDPTNV